MTDTPPLTIAYLERLPEFSARVVAGMRPQDAAALFEAIPTRILTPVFEKMEKWPAAQCLQHLSDERAAAIIANALYQDATVLLRLTPAERREGIYAQLPSALARDLKESLRYPRNTVGAWMDLSVPTLSLNSSVKDAISVVRGAGGQISDPIFVVDENESLAGVLRAESLLRYSPSTEIANLMQTGLKPLFARMLLREVATSAIWDDFISLPVASRRGQLIGALSRTDLKAGLNTISTALNDAETKNSIPEQLGDSLVVSISGLIRLFDSDDSDQNATVEI